MVKELIKLLEGLEGDIPKVLLKFLQCMKEAEDDEEQAQEHMRRYKARIEQARRVLRGEDDE
jgi:hypothetical protein